jgi:hypothetical protein
MISDHGKVAKIWLTIIENAPRDSKERFGSARFIKIKQFVCEIVRVSHPEVEGLKPSLPLQNAHDVSIPLSGLRIFAARYNTG